VRRVDEREVICKSDLQNWDGVREDRIQKVNCVGRGVALRIQVLTCLCTRRLLCSGRSVPLLENALMYTVVPHFLRDILLSSLR
jgi:hypothetical protein